MLIKVYDERIITPLKSGSRYIGRNFTESYSFNTECTKRHRLSGIDTIIIRNPIEAFYSALHTELLSHIQNCGGKLHLINPGSVLTAFKINNSPHWSPYLNKWLMKLWIYQFPKAEIVDMSELTDWVNAQSGISPYIQTDYDFHDTFDYWVDKWEIVEMYKKQYVDEWKELEKLIFEDLIWYNHLLNRNKGMEIIKLI